MDRSVYAALSTVFIAISLIGCGETYIKQGNVTNGVFEVNVPDNFSGIGKNVTQHSSVHNINLGLDYTTQEKMKMSGAFNDKLQYSDYDDLVGENNKQNYDILPKTKIKDFKYSRYRFPISLSFTSIDKEESFVHGYTIGFDPGIYWRYILGVNKEFFEAGGFFDLSLNPFADNSFDFYECTTREKGCEEKSEIKHLDQDNNSQGRWGLGAFASAYYGRFALSYSPAIYFYTNSMTEEEYKSDKYDGTAELRFRLTQPPILSQYIGASSWIADKWKFSLGAKVLSPIDLNDFYWSINTSIGYWF